MRNVDRFIIALGLSLSAGCGRNADGVGGLPGHTPPGAPPGLPDIPLPAGSAAFCDGVCVDAAPATYTGPSLFWLGQAALAPACPPETPLQGIEGFVSGFSGAFIARECLVTPSSRCGLQGITCVPFPRQDYHLCIHRETATSCPADYPERNELSEEGNGVPVTLCCQKLPAAG